MNGPLDGLESVSLMQHGIGRSYTTDSGMNTKEENDFASPQKDSERGREGKEELDYMESDAPLLSQFHEDAIQQAGMGAFQRILLMVTGLGLAADTIELFVVAYVIPSAEVELCMSGRDKGWLAAITFVGMMIGAMIWGTLSDTIGRRRALLSALFVNAVFGLMTAFMPTYGIFMTTRLCSGIGVGGGIPIVFAYYCEFIARTDRGRHLSWLLIFWAIGGVFTALMAWAIIPRTGITVVLDEQHHFSSWRMFLVVCSLPSFVAVIGLYFMPESPRFLLEKGRDVEAMMVYKKIFKWNNSHNPKAEYQLTELELPSGTHRPLRSNVQHSTDKGFLTDLYYSFNQFLDTDFYDYRFENCRMTNNTFRALVPGCELDFDYNIHYKDVFQENLIGQLTMIPGTIIASMIMDRIGRSRIMCASMLVSGLSAFFIWFLNTKTSIIVFEAIFNFIFVSGWNALDIATTEAFPTQIRTTAYGFLSATSRIAGILGSLCFGNFIYVSRTIPMLTTSAVLLVGGLVATRMPETRDALM
ncbi:Synaptic vesicle glycoprotein 2B [Armadillidium nasatum]|uniref:Synaptic vesicle glycoprotein 2B n=1 Tax=Armadillidium nasatum TaxID=96803 RepID=A0A5N5SVV6_9CRUS|nr:Synaptic vesicle glycoprotein 2B [Armadillidium nasatum]